MVVVDNNYEAVQPVELDYSLKNMMRLLDRNMVEKFDWQSVLKEV